MTPQELKESILQLAIQGKLVEQRPEEGTAAEGLNKYGKKPAAEDDSIDLPEAWCWARLADITTILYGFPFNSERFNEARIGMPIIRIRDIISGQSKTYSDENCDERYRIKRGDMLVGMDGNFQVAFWNSEDAWLNQRVCRITADASLLDQTYLYFYLPIILQEINGSVSYSTVKHLSAKILNAMVIPLPPLEEQKRIVARIEELLPLVERYEKAWSRLEDFNKRFPGDMQKSILQMAIQGKLVEQRPEEGTGEELYRQIQAEKQALIQSGKLKKQKPLPEITEDEIPFDIPESWKWVRLRELSETIGDGIHGTPEFQIDGGYYFINGNNLDNGNIVFRSDTKRVGQMEYEKYKKPLTESTILISINGTIGNIAYYNNERIILGKSACYVALFPGIYRNYLRILFESKFFFDYAFREATQTTIKNVSLKAIRMLPVPLPPLAEQKRIVARLEELLPLCVKLK